MRQGKKRSTLILLLFLLAGGFVGDLLGTLAARMLPVLGHPVMLGSEHPWVLNLALLKLTLGLQVGMNWLGLLGLLVAAIIWMRT